MSCIKMISGFQKFWCFLVAVFLSATYVEAEAPSQDTYLWVYVKMHDAENSEKNKDYLGALIQYRMASVWLEKCYDLDPTWESALVLKRLKEIQVKIKELKPLAAHQYLSANKPPIIADSVVSSFYEKGIEPQKTNDNREALRQLVTYQTYVEIIQNENPTWETSFVEQRFKEVQRLVDELATAIVKQEAIDRASPGGRPIQ